MRYSATAFGFDWESDVPLPAFAARTVPASFAVIRVRLVSGAVPDRGVLQSHGNVRFAKDGFRYLAGEVMTLDVYDVGRIDLYPGAAWTGVAPVSLFSTVAGLLCASLGCLPLHGSAVAYNGEATLICGPAGAGKSTAVARLLAEGALLISDDLSVLHPDPSGGVPKLFAGRRFVRLHPHPAKVLAEAVIVRAQSEPAQSKIAVYPPQVSAIEAVPLTRVIVLGQAVGEVGSAEKASLLARHFFRPLCLQKMPGYEHRLAVLAVAARSIHVEGGPAMPAYPWRSPA